ncbi:MAG TPA: DUF1080 domain-containing protein [Planctomycetota bacterium]|nr:DUF1080 domain-containing protein [Planctomycetota bacterium]OQC20185.1 MAG: HEAT repeat protein [Planctomycetes bacterium ADurb.Bin069]HNR99327.1 DUF1080 domain-containing protein [Planctomycetota bacterium]HNU26058.1 DUF1080 domain-containing protein [Planctomycetota bacterium]HOE30833.1 DUF1080 domain-containing protein [Planctomycetota bacterium]
MNRMLFATMSAALACGAARAAETRTVELLDAPVMSAWQLPTGKWEVAGEVAQRPDKPGLLAWKAGRGAIVNGDDGRTCNIHSKIEHGDCEAHIEFMVPQGSNSGVYFQARYEIQVFDSWDAAANAPKADPKHSDCGGIYERWGANGGYEGHGPRVNACKAPGQWQTFDVVFRAPRFDASGRKTANACFVKVVHNGVLVHENVEVTGPTRAATWENDEKPLGPLMLQGDHGPVAYRNIRITLPVSDIAAAADAVLPESALPALMKFEFGRERKQEAALELALRSAAAEVVAVVEARLLAVLAAKDATFAAKQWVCRLLRAIGTEQAVPVLAGLLADKELAHFARLALQHCPSPKAGEALRAALGALEGDLKTGVVSSLGERGDAKAVAQIAALADSKDEMLAQAAIRALGRIGTAEAAAALADAPVAREHRALAGDSALLCADGMLARGDAAGAAAIYRAYTERRHDPMVRLAAFRGLVLAEKEKAVPLVLDLLDDRDAKIREAAYLFMGQMPGVETTKAFAAKLPALPPASRAALIAVLAGRGDQAALPAVLAALDDADQDVRVAAITALATLGDASAVPPLLAAAARGGATGEAAARTLARLPGDDVSRALVRTLQDKPDTAATAADILVKRRDKAAFPALKELAKQKNAHAARAYGRMLDWAADGSPETLAAMFEEAMTLAPDVAAQRLVLGAAAKRAALWSLEFVEKYRADAKLKAAADAAHAKISAALDKMPLLENETVLKAAEAEIHGGGAVYEDGANRDCIGVWTSAQAWVSWDVMIKTPGTFEVKIAQSMAGIPGGTYNVIVGDQALKGTVKDTHDWARFEAIALGRVTIAKPGAYTVAFKPIKLVGTYLINLRSVTLTRVR